GRRERPPGRAAARPPADAGRPGGDGPPRGRHHQRAGGHAWSGRQRAGDRGVVLISPTTSRVQEVAMMKYSALLPLLVAGVLAGLANAAGPQDEKYSGDLYKDRYEAARKVYAGYLRDLRVGPPSKVSIMEIAEHLYRWSRRMLEAEQALAE